MRISEAATILGLKAPFTAKQAKRVYHQLAMIHHPDKNGTAEMMAKINEAYRLCSKGMTLKPAPKITMCGVDIGPINWFRVEKRKKGPSIHNVVKWFSEQMALVLVVEARDWTREKASKQYENLCHESNALFEKLKRLSEKDGADNKDKQGLIQQCVKIANVALTIADNARRKL